MNSADRDCSQLPLCEAPPCDDVTLEEERRDDVAVLTSEDGITGSHSLNGKRTKYLVQPRLQKLKFNCRWRQGAVLGLGVFLTILALTLVVVGAVRSREHTAFKLLHIKHPVNLKSLVYIGDENFTFAQLSALTNVAIDKPAFLSSISKRDSAKTDTEPWHANNAVDGNVTTCTATGLERTPSWTVDLLGNKTIGSVRIHGSTVNKLHDIDVYVSQTGNITAVEDRVLCGKMEGDRKTMDLRIHCTQSVRGRYVTIELQTKKDTFESLVLCEVLIFQ